MFIDKEEFRELLNIIKRMEKDIKFLREERENVGCRKKENINSKEIDLLGEFIQEIECDNERERKTVSASDFYEMFNKWHLDKSGNLSNLSERMFGITVGKIYTRVRKAKGKAYLNVPVKFNSNALDFITDLQGEIRNQVLAGELYNEYKEWCLNVEADEILSRNQFGAIAKSRLDKKRTSAGYVYLNVPSIK